MAQLPESLAVDPTYLEFFGLTRAPFATLADPDQQFQSEQYLLLMRHLEFAAANADSLVVVCGADGSGKSTLVSRFMGTIQDQVSCVLIDAASCQGVVPFYTTFLQQIGFDEITGTASELGNITKEFLVCRGIARDHILVIIDNTHLVDPRILEQLQRLCDVKIKDRRAISVVLFGNADIVRVVDAPAMRQTAFASHVVFNIRNYSEQETASYIRHLLELSGADHDLRFSDAVCSLIHRYTGGVPHRISKLGVDALEEAYRLNSRTVSTDIVRAVINRQRLLPHVTPLTGKRRRRSDPTAEPKAAPDSADFEASQERIAELATHIDNLEASRSRALREVDGRNDKIQSLRDQLDALKKEAESLAQSAASQSAVIARQNQELSDRAGQLKESEGEVRRLTSELARELRSREATQERLDKAIAAIVELSRSKQELQATVDAAEAELRNDRSAAGQRAVETEALERATVHLRAEVAAKTTELESLRSELASRNAAVADLELRLESRSRADEAAAITAQNQALSDSTASLQASEIRAKHLATELSNALHLRDAALERLDKANVAVAELTRSRDGLQRTVDGLKADLRSARDVADQGVVETDALKKTTAQLRMEIAERMAELGSMRGELASRNAALGELELRLEMSRSECEAARSRIATLKAPAEFQALERDVQGLGADLETEREARRVADKSRDEAAAALQQLREHEEELQATVRQLDAELKSSSERAFAAYALENYVADLQAALEKRTSELNARTQTVADLEGQIEKLRNECESLRSRAVSASSRDAGAPRPARGEPVAEDRAYSSKVVALYERSLTRIPAYRMLKERDRAFYDGLIREYQVLVGQGLSDKQINDALRANQAKWMERQLARASDGTMITYARLLVDQLDELLLDGVEPCLSLLVPQARPVKGMVPDYSGRTAERELDLLNMVLTTYDARRVLPKEDDVWPDLEPVFAELFESFGADNVAAIENSFDPKMDRSLLCKVSRTLFLRILALPESKAAAALRWMLASK